MGLFISTANEEPFSRNTFWQLRTPGTANDTVVYCGPKGQLMIGTGVSGTGQGVVPAMYLKLSSPLWSLCEDGNDPGYHFIYTITFDGNGVPIKDNTTKTNEYGKVKLPAVEREGYTLKGWYTEKEGGVKVTEDTVFEADTTVYAQWTKIEIPEYTITFDGNGVTILDNVYKTDKYGRVKLPSVERNGYTLKGWYTDKEGGSQITEKTVFNKDMTVYAWWVKNTGAIAPDKAVIKSVTNKKAGAITIKMKSPEADGYEVAYALSKKKLSKVKKFKTFTKTNFTIKKLKKGKSYFIKVRAYKLSGGKKVYGAWSKAKKVKIKK
jgi:uncharacterized repeat protein (TIGR02543 family)